MYSICKLLSLSLFTCLAHSKEVHYKKSTKMRKNFTVISRYLNKIFVTFPIPYLDMIIVCFIYFDNSLFWPLYGYWSRGQTDIYGLFCVFVAPPRKKNLVTIFSQGHVLGPWKPMFYLVFCGQLSVNGL